MLSRRLLIHVEANVMSSIEITAAQTLIKRTNIDIWQYIQVIVFSMSSCIYYNGLVCLLNLNVWKQAIRF